MATTQLHSLKYYNKKGGRLIETIMYEMPITLCKWKKRVLGNTTHSIGYLEVKKVNKKGS